ncbi:MAG: alpha/beta hydrolase [Desulfobacterales bacterium]
MSPRNITIDFSGETLKAALFPADGSNPAAAPCLILCHGAFERKENFFEFAEFLAGQNIAAIAVDMPGHGESAGPRSHLDMGEWVKAIQAVIDDLSSHQGIDPARIGAFGFSSGGTAVLEAALAESRIKAIVTLDATVRNYLNIRETLFFKFLVSAGRVKKRLTGTGWRFNMLSVLKSATVAYDPTINRQIINDPSLIEAYSAFPLPGAASCAFVDTISRVHAIQIPTLVMHGKEDKVDPPETAKMLFDALTCEKSLELIPESGHSGHLDTQKTAIMAHTRQWAQTYL